MKMDESWPSFQPHPDDHAYCYICGQTQGNHGEAPAVHCPPAVLRPRPPQSATSKHYDEKISRLRTIATEIQEVLGVELVDPSETGTGSIAMHNRGAELLDLADELAPVVQAYPHPGVADQAFAVVTELVVKLLYDSEGRRDCVELTSAQVSTLLLYSIAAKAQNAGMQSMIGSALTAFAGSALAAGIGEAGRKAAREVLLEESGANVPRKKKH